MLQQFRDLAEILELSPEFFENHPVRDLTRFWWYYCKTYQIYHLNSDYNNGEDDADFCLWFRYIHIDRPNFRIVEIEDYEGLFYYVILDKKKELKE